MRDLINGFFIVFEDQFVVGDLIQANGETGRVEYLTIRRTVIRNAAGAVVTPRTVVPPRSLVRGQPARVARPLNDTDWSQGRLSAEYYVGLSQEHRRTET